MRIYSSSEIRATYNKKIVGKTRDPRLVEAESIIRLQLTKFSFSRFRRMKHELRLEATCRSNRLLLPFHQLRTLVTGHNQKRGNCLLHVSA